MDHHCGIISTCVGFRNYKAFLLFLGYTTLLCLHSAAVAAYTLYHFVQNVPDAFLLSPVNWAMILMLGAIFGMVLCGFGAYHAYLARSNRTTIENMETTRIKLGTYSAENAQANDEIVAAQNVPSYRGDNSLSWEERRALRRAAADSRKSTCHSVQRIQQTDCDFSLRFQTFMISAGGATLSLCLEMTVLLMVQACYRLGCRIFRLSVKALAMDTCST